MCVFADDRKAEATGGVVPFTTEMRKEVRRITRRLNQDGLRALAGAYKWLPPEDRSYTVEDEKELALSGYVAFLDPPKETAREAVAALREHGVAVKIITGDNEVVTRKICKEVGLPIEHAMLGKDVEKLSEAQLEEAAELTTIFAKMAPVQKSRVIRALQRNGHTVGFTTRFVLWCWSRQSAVQHRGIFTMSWCRIAARRSLSEADRHKRSPGGRDTPGSALGRLA